MSSACERIVGCPKEALLRNIQLFNDYLFPSDLKNYHPLLEMVQTIKQKGPEARLKEKYRVISRKNKEVKWIEDRGQPLYDKDGKYIGICGVAVDVTYKKIIYEAKDCFLTNFPENNQSRYYLKGKYRKIYLTSREAECAFYMLQGKTSKETAKKLNISYRTVEDILQKIKNKLNVNYRSELFKILIDNCFLQNLT